MLDVLNRIHVYSESPLQSAVSLRDAAHVTAAT